MFAMSGVIVVLVFLFCSKLALRVGTTHNRMGARELFELRKKNVNNPIEIIKFVGIAKKFGNFF